MENKKILEDIRTKLSFEFVVLIRLAKKNEIGAFRCSRNGIFAIADFLFEVGLMDENTNLRIYRLVGLVSKKYMY